jgi:hypothetical protein
MQLFRVRSGLPGQKEVGIWYGQDGDGRSGWKDFSPPIAAFATRQWFDDLPFVSR